MCIAVIAIAGAVILYDSPSSEGRLSSVEPPQVPKPAPPSSIPVESRIDGTRLDGAQQTKTEPVVEGMASQFNRAGSLRAFFYQAIRSPEQGGLMYGIAALGACRKYITGAAPKPTGYSPERETAIRSLTVRCEMTEGDRSSGLAQVAHDRVTNWNIDPIFHRTMVLVQAKSATERRRAIENLLELQDPIVFETLLSPVTRGENEETFFNEVWYSGESGEQTIQLAVTMARCELGWSCDANSLANLTMCAERGWCGENVKESIRLGLGMQSTDFASTMQLASQLVAAFRQRTTTAFIQK